MSADVDSPKIGSKATHTLHNALQAAIFIRFLHDGHILSIGKAVIAAKTELN
jgi:hypothetical protein